MENKLAEFIPCSLVLRNTIIYSQPNYKGFYNENQFILSQFLKVVNN